MNKLQMLESMKHSPLHNYAGIPGLTSWLIGNTSRHGTVRLMECSRDHFEPVTPHSHRFDFVCEVLAGQVTNVLWEEVEYPRKDGDRFQVIEMRYTGVPGQYESTPSLIANFRRKSEPYRTGEVYQMKSDQIHSIYFSKGAQVLFLEGPQTTDTSSILQPFVNDKMIPTFRVEDWMYSPGG